MDKDLFPYYLGRLDDMPGLVNRGATMKQRVSLQMRRHVERINLAGGLDNVPILVHSQPDFGALA